MSVFDFDLLKIRYGAQALNPWLFQASHNIFECTAGYSSLTCLGIFFKQLLVPEIESESPEASK